MGFEPDRIVELRFVLDTDKVEDPHTDAVTPDSEPYVAAGQVLLLEEGLQRAGQSIPVANFAADDDAVLERTTGDLQELSPLRGLGHDGGRELGRADLEADDAATIGSAAPSCLAVLVGARRRLGRCRHDDRSRSRDVTLRVIAPDVVLVARLG